MKRVAIKRQSIFNQMLTIKGEIKRMAERMSERCVCVCVCVHFDIIYKDSNAYTWKSCRKKHRLTNACIAHRLDNFCELFRKTHFKQTISFIENANRNSCERILCILYDVHDTSRRSDNANLEFSKMIIFLMLSQKKAQVTTLLSWLEINSINSEEVYIEALFLRV